MSSTYIELTSSDAGNAKVKIVSHGIESIKETDDGGCAVLVSDTWIPVQESSDEVDKLVKDHFTGVVARMESNKKDKDIPEDMIELTQPLTGKKMYFRHYSIYFVGPCVDPNEGVKGVTTIVMGNKVQYVVAESVEEVTKKIAEKE